MISANQQGAGLQVTERGLLRRCRRIRGQAERSPRLSQLGQPGAPEYLRELVKGDCWGDFPKVFEGGLEPYCTISDTILITAAWLSNFWPGSWFG